MDARFDVAFRSASFESGSPIFRLCVTHVIPPPALTGGAWPVAASSQPHEGVRSPFLFLRDRQSG